jgi:hypothetical protein
MWCEAAWKSRPNDCSKACGTIKYDNETIASHKLDRVSKRTNELLAAIFLPRISNDHGSLIKDISSVKMERAYIPIPSVARNETLCLPFVLVVHDADGFDGHHAALDHSS